MDSFGTRLRRYRGERQWSLSDLSARTHYSPGHLSKVENDLRMPTRELAASCDAALGARGQLLAALGAGRTDDTARGTGGSAGSAPQAARPDEAALPALPATLSDGAAAPVVAALTTVLDGLRATAQSARPRGRAGERGRTGAGPAQHGDAHPRPRFRTPALPGRPLRGVRRLDVPGGRRRTVRPQLGAHHGLPRPARRLTGHRGQRRPAALPARPLLRRRRRHRRTRLRRSRLHVLLGHPGTGSSSLGPGPRPQRRRPPLSPSARRRLQPSLRHQLRHAAMGAVTTAPGTSRIPPPWQGAGASKCSATTTRRSAC